MNAVVSATKYLNFVFTISAVLHVHCEPQLKEVVKCHISAVFVYSLLLAASNPRIWDGLNRIQTDRKISTIDVTVQ